MDRTANGERETFQPSLGRFFLEALRDTPRRGRPKGDIRPTVSLKQCGPSIRTFTASACSTGRQINTVRTERPYSYVAIAHAVIARTWEEFCCDAARGDSAALKLPLAAQYSRTSADTQPEESCHPWPPWHSRSLSTEFAERRRSSKRLTLVSNSRRPNQTRTVLLSLPLRVSCRRARFSVRWKAQPAVAVSRSRASLRSCCRCLPTLCGCPRPCARPPETR